MKRKVGWIATTIGAVVVSLAVVSAQQTSTTTEMKRFEVISVDGNKTVLRAADGTSKEYNVPEDFRFDVGGQKMSVHDLKPGMKGTATITTTTTVTPVTVTEVKNGEVLQASGGSVLVRTPTGYRMFTQGDVEKRNITVVRDGKAVDISELRAGDRLTATIVTEKPPKVMTERQVQATIHPETASSGAAGAPASATSARATSGGGTAPAGSTSGSTSGGAAASTSAGTKKTLPKTASGTPSVGALGLGALTLALALRIRRRVA